MTKTETIKLGQALAKVMPDPTQTDAFTMRVWLNSVNAIRDVVESDERMDSGAFMRACGLGNFPLIRSASHEE